MKMLSNLWLHGSGSAVFHFDVFLFISQRFQRLRVTLNFEIDLSDFKPVSGEAEFAS